MESEGSENGCGRARVEVEVECAERTIWGELKFLDHPHGSVMKSLKVSVDALPANQDETLPDMLRGYQKVCVRVIT